MKRSEYTLQRIAQEIEHALQGMSDADQAWLLAHIRAHCWRRLLKLDELARHAAEMDATSPLNLLRNSLGDEEPEPLSSANRGNTDD